MRGCALFVLVGCRCLLVTVCCIWLVACCVALGRCCVALPACGLVGLVFSVSLFRVWLVILVYCCLFICCLLSWFAFVRC